MKKEEDLYISLQRPGTEFQKDIKNIIKNKSKNLLKIKLKAEK